MPTGSGTLALTRDFRETIQARIERDPAFRVALLKEGVECLLSGDVETGKEWPDLESLKRAQG
jgi:hypothetical protein